MDFEIDIAVDGSGLSVQFRGASSSAISEDVVHFLDTPSTNLELLNQYSDYFRALRCVTFYTKFLEKDDRLGKAIFKWSSYGEVFVCSQGNPSVIGAGLIHLALHFVVASYTRTLHVQDLCRMWRTLLAHPTLTKKKKEGYACANTRDVAFCKTVTRSPTLVDNSHV